jgi:hypothetical protein
MIEAWLNSKIFKPLGFIIAKKSTMDADAKTLWDNGNLSGLRAGVEIGRLAILRDLRDNISPAKWQEISTRYGFKSLDEKYPENPLLERQNGKKDSKLRPETIGSDEKDASA